MSEKSNVGMDDRICPVCGKQHTVGLLLDKRLRNSLERHNVTGWALCPEHQKMADEGFIALVGVDPEKSTFEPDGNLKLQGAYRTGNVAHLRASAWERVMNMPLPSGGAPMAFVEDGVIDILRAQAGEADEEEGGEG